jgi:uncharacterized protein (DUF2236 family)
MLAGAGRLPIPRWYRNLTAHLMPERLRASFGLPFGEEERQSALRALRFIRRIYPVLPTRLRYVAPFHEALGRLGGRSQPDLMTRALNRLWIGRERMDD